MNISSVSSSNLAYLQSLQAASTSAADTAETDSTEADAVLDATASVQTAQYDTFSLGSTISASNNALLAATESYDTLDLSDEAIEYLNTQQAASSASAAEEKEDTESSDSTADLSLYTETQLKQMVEDGELTEAEYNAELSRREALQKQQEASTVDSQDTDASLVSRESDI